MKDWQKVEDVFGKALELPETERSAYLDEACGEDGELREEIEGLLRADAGASSFLDEAIPIPEPPPLAFPMTPGQRLGAYRILGAIGEGGMGTVYKAERNDGAFQRQVAVKVLRWDRSSPLAADLLERERQILANLDHPGIARLLDGGTTDEGFPYVVMELVNGEPIDKACDRRRLSPAQRVDLMIQVCDAVTEAHRKLIVHRDIKPANILVDESGQPKLLDFGIAKLLGNLDLGSTAETTESWHRKLSPSYASPEQLRGERVTVSTDVYLLGLVLYKLLAGEPAYRFEDRSMVEIIDHVTLTAPQRPSEIARGVDADLDAIVLKALRVEPKARYGSVEALADDLRRFRRGFPVHARQGSLRYMTGKFLKRYWVPLSVAMLVLSLVTVFTISTKLQAQRLEQTLGRLASVEGFMTDLFWSISPNEAVGQEIFVRDVLERGEGQLTQSLVKDQGTQALLHGLIGRIRRHLGDLEGARDHLENAVAIYSGVGGSDFVRAAEARVMGDLAMTHLYLGDGEAAEELALKALDAGRQRLPTRSDVYVELLNNVSTVYCWGQRWDDAAPYVDEAVGLFAGREDTMSLPNAVALSMKALLVKNVDKQPEEAAQHYERSLDIFRRLEGNVNSEVANILNQLGLISRDSGDLDAARGYLEEAVEIRQKLYPPGHLELAQGFYQLGLFHRKLGDFVRAEELLNEAWTIYAEHPERGKKNGRTIFYWLHLAEVRLAQGRADEAREMIDELSEEWWASRKPTSQLLSLAERALGCTLSAQGELEEAEPLLRKSLASLAERYGDESWESEIARDCLENVQSRLLADS